VRRDNQAVSVVLFESKIILVLLNTESISMKVKEHIYIMCLHDGLERPPLAFFIYSSQKRKCIKQYRIRYKHVFGAILRLNYNISKACEL